MNSKLKHSLALLITVFLIFIWAISPYTSFATQIIASLFALFLTKHVFSHHLSTRTESLIDSIILTAVILVIISATGGLSSPVFFLVYFLLFTLSLLLEPVIPLVLSFGLIFYFLFSNPIGSIQELLPLLSFPLITPLAVYFGKQHQSDLYHRHDVLHLKETIRRETQDVLLWLTTTFNKEMTLLQKTLDQFPDISKIQEPYHKQIYNITIKLKRLGEKLKKAIEED